MSNIAEREKIENLVLLCQQGDKEAFSQLYDLIADKIFRFVYFKTKPEDSEDLTEIIFLKIWQKINQYENTEGFFIAWSLKIAHNTIIDYYRTRRPLFPMDEKFIIEDSDEESNPKRLAEKKLNKDLIRSALDKLNDPYKEIIILKYIQDLSNEEIALITGRSQVSIRVIHHRGLGKLKNILSKIGYQET